MNQMQKVVLYVGIAITVLMVLFPPWTSTYKLHSAYDPNKVSIPIVMLRKCGSLVDICGSLITK